MIETVREKISEWFDEGKEKGATHMIVVCNTIFLVDEPVYVFPGDNVRELHDELVSDSLFSLKAVYALHMDKQHQLNEVCALNFDQPAPQAEDLIETSVDFRDQPTVVANKRKHSTNGEHPDNESIRRAERFLRSGLGINADKHKGLLGVISALLVKELRIDWEQVEKDVAQFSHLIVTHLGDKMMGRLFEASIADPPRLLALVEDHMNREMKGQPSD